MHVEQKVESSGGHSQRLPGPWAISMASHSRCAQARLPYSGSAFSPGFSFHYLSHVPVCFVSVPFTSGLSVSYCVLLWFCFLVLFLNWNWGNRFPPTHKKEWWRTLSFPPRKAKNETKLVSNVQLRQERTVEQRLYLSDFLYGMRT